MLVQKIRQKHTVARNYFSKMSTMTKYFAANGSSRSVSHGPTSISELPGLSIASSH